MKSVEGYRFNARRLRSFGVLEAWYLHTYPGGITRFISSILKRRQPAERRYRRALKDA
jgi:hypothetical protein